MTDIQHLDINGTTYDLKAVSVVDQGGGALKSWSGTSSAYDLIDPKNSKTLYYVTDSGEIYLGSIALGKGGGNRNIGEIVTSTIPLTDAGLHLLDGALINGSGIYSAFVDYIADLYDNTETHIVDNVKNIGKVIISDHVASGFSTSPLKYLQLYNKFNPASTDIWECVIDFTTGSSLSAYQYLINTGTSGNPHYYGFSFYISNAGVIGVSIGKGESASNYSLITGSTLSVNTHYKAKLVCDGNGTYSLYLKSDSDTDFVLQNSVSGIVMAYSDAYNYKPFIGAEYVITSTSGDNLWYYPFLGSIDLSGCYIKVNDSTWWEGTTEVKNGFTTELNWQNSVSFYGACGKFVYDSVNNTVRLPKITGFIEGTTDVVALGDLVEAGLPNITGVIGNWRGNTLIGNVSGAFASGTGAAQPYPTPLSSATSTTYNFTFDASLSSSIYGNSSTVQPQTIKVLYYIVIATLTKTDIEVDIDEIVTDLNGKANVDLTNINTSGKTNLVRIANQLDWDNKIEITTTPSTSYRTYTAVGDGLFYAYAIGVSTSSNAKYAQIIIQNADGSQIYVRDENVFGSAVGISYLSASGSWFMQSAETVRYYAYTGGFNSNYVHVYFIPFKKA